MRFILIGQLFENISQPTLRVGDKKIKRYLIISSVVFHFLIVIIGLTINSTNSKKLTDIPRQSVMIFPVSSYFYDIRPPPPPKQKLKTKKPNKPIGKSLQPTTPIPIEIPNEIKNKVQPEPPEKPDKDLSDSKEDDALSDSDAGEKDGVSGGVPGGVTNKPSSSDKGPIIIDGNVSPPKRIKYFHPTYPPIALKTKTEGTVILEAIIGKNGKIKNIKITKSIPLLDQAALEAIKKWEYTPTIVNGEAREVLLTITVNFKIK